MAFVCNQNPQKSPQIKKVQLEAKAFARKKILEASDLDINSLIQVVHSYGGRNTVKVSSHKEIVIKYARLVEKKLRQTFDYNPLLQVASQKVKVFMEKAVQENISLSQQQKKVMITAIRNYGTYVTPEKMLENKISASGYMMMCTPSGLLDNATSNFICPGRLIQMMNASREDAIASLFMIMAHEMGHNLRIDWNSYTKNYMNCLKNNYSNHPITRAPASQYFSSDFSRLGSEINADYWAAEASNQYLKTLPFAKRASFLQRGWNVMCAHMNGTKLGHPMGWFRLGVSLRRHPGIAASLGCPVHYQNIAVSCSLKGEDRVCGPKQRMPHWKKVGNRCLPSCGAAKGQYCKNNNCLGLKLASGALCSSPFSNYEYIVHLESYDERLCCMLKERNISVCGSKQRMPHWKKVGNRCLPSCGAAKGQYCKNNNCLGLKLASGALCSSPFSNYEYIVHLESYDERLCCMLKERNISVCGSKQRMPHWKKVGNRCLPSCGSGQRTVL